MNEETFNEALKKYKVVRKPDYMKVRWNRNRPGEQGNNKRRQAEEFDDTVIDTSTVDSDAGFWEYLESALKDVDGVTKMELNKLLAALRHEHNTLAPKLNLADLDKIAASLV